MTTEWLNSDYRAVVLNLFARCKRGNAVLSTHGKLTTAAAIFHDVPNFFHIN